MWPCECLRMSSVCRPLLACRLVGLYAYAVPSAHTLLLFPKCEIDCASLKCARVSFPEKMLSTAAALLCHGIRAGAVEPSLYFCRCCVFCMTTLLSLVDYVLFTLSVWFCNFRAGKYSEDVRKICKHKKNLSDSMSSPSLKSKKPTLKNLLGCSSLLPNLMSTSYSKIFTLN